MERYKANNRKLIETLNSMLSESVIMTSDELIADDRDNAERYSEYDYWVIPRTWGDEKGFEYLHEVVTYISESLDIL